MSALRMSDVTTVLFDADGNLFPSEPVALEASAPVTDRLAEALGLTERFTPESLRVATTGRNFRSLAGEFSAGGGRWSEPVRRLDDDELERWVAEENRVVSDHLRLHLQPDVDVVDAVGRIAAAFAVAVVSASSIGRLQACFSATGLAPFFPPERCFSAEDSLPVPVSKPDPAIYLEALRRLDLRPEQAVAIEDSVRGVQAAVAAGCPTIGNLAFVEAEDRGTHAADLRAAGVSAVVETWAEVVDLLVPQQPAPAGGGPHHHPAERQEHR
jgi:beta-phosphoglucomutase-like phosphatase (HAD superfamily)